MNIVRTAATTPSGFLFFLAAIAFVLVCHTPLAVEGFMTGPRTTNETLVGTNMTLAFTPNVPDVFLQFKRLNGEILPGYNETFKWISLDEVDNSTGTAVRDGIPVVVQSLDLQDTSLVWTETVSYPLDSNNNVYKNVNFSTTFPNGVAITISYYYYMNDFLSVYSYINSSRTIPADSFKVSLTISGWQPISMSNLFLVRIDVFAAPYFSNVRFNLVNFTWTINTDLGSGGVLQTLNFLSESVVDGLSTHITWYNEYVGLVLIPDIRVNGFKEYFYFPNWQNSLFYDPDFSALVQDQGTGSNGDGGSDDTTTIVIAVLVPTVVTGALVFIIVAVIIGLIVSKRKLLSIHKRLKTVESLNNEITTEEA